ncbi:unnamed protein product, partial [Linum tenue]
MLLELSSKVGFTKQFSALAIFWQFSSFEVATLRPWKTTLMT